MKTKRITKGRLLLPKRKALAARTITQGVKAGQEAALRLCPVDKGDLASTITIEDDGAGHASLGTGGQSNASDMKVNHHVYIEYGTSKMGAQPNYRPGVETAKAHIRSQMRKSRG